MKSWEVLRDAAERIGVKALAAQLKLSSAMVYKWCQESSIEDPDSSGARNPLDRLAEIIEATSNLNVVHWLCHQAGGFYVRNPLRSTASPNEIELLKSTHLLVSEFSDLLAIVTHSIEDDKKIEPLEADQIRQKWELLKSSAESFVVACEVGCYSTAPPDPVP
ncbi:MAG: hypothetical protein HJJLKODD_02472 [Phycisphaerae bacterium]|nr:hypothetical protein [Phycisphaerae bacterium]